MFSHWLRISKNKYKTFVKTLKSCGFESYHKPNGTKVETDYFNNGEGGEVLLKKTTVTKVNGEKKTSYFKHKYYL